MDQPREVKAKTCRNLNNVSAHIFEQFTLRNKGPILALSKCHTSCSFMDELIQNEDPKYLFQEEINLYCIIKLAT